MRTENWCGHEIRFIEINGEWYAILKDICDALKLRTDKIASRLYPEMLERIKVEVSNNPSRVVRSEDGAHDLGYEHKSIDRIDRGMIGKDIGRQPGENKTRWMLAVNEAGIYQALFASRKLEARKFQLWTFDILKKLRKNVGLQGYEVMRMTEPDIQERIDWILDGLYWDDEKKCVMYSKTIQGGDVEQIPFNQYIEEE